MCADGKLTAGQLAVRTTSADEPHIVWRLNVRDLSPCKARLWAMVLPPKWMGHQ